MTAQAPPLQDGEEIVFDHIPSLSAFKRTSLVLIMLTLPAVIAFAVAFPDTIWPVVPLFVTCVLLMQERFRLGRYRAWLTNRRVILQGGRDVPLGDITGVKAHVFGVRLAGSGVTMAYVGDKPALVAAINAAREKT